MTERRAPVTAPELLLKIVLTGTQSHYDKPGLIDEKRLDHLLQSGKQILYKSHQESDVRQNLGFSPAIWDGLTAVLSRALPVLETQSFSWRNEQGNTTYGGSSSDLIAAHYFSLVKDIERINDLCTIARNLLATTRRAQNLAADKGFDQQILKLIDICVRVTARGFDGLTTTTTDARGAMLQDQIDKRNEEKWQKVVNLYKRLLITCLQFLHNFIMHNEQRKLVLWLDLFGNTSVVAQRAEQDEIRAVQDQVGLEERFDGHQMDESDDAEERSHRPGQMEQTNSTVHEVISGLQQLTSADLGYNIEDVHALFELLSAEKALDDAGREKKKYLMDKIRTDLEKMSGLTASQLDDKPDILLRAGAALREHLAMRDSHVKLTTRASVEGHGTCAQVEQISNLALHPSHRTTPEQEITEEDLVMPRTTAIAAETLQEAKDELMARLTDNNAVSDEDGQPVYEDELDGDDLVEESVVDSAVESMQEDEDEGEPIPEDYTHPGDQERGLLTDVPLVLGPTEIEALPMIIQAGIVDNFGSKSSGERRGARNMQAVRCHILLAQEAGRNVLRELLIFIAAWDLPDDEFYFKMMVQIMEAILQNGLMSHAYSDFGQPKDIISPAQAVVIKILTHIFRSKYSPSASQTSKHGVSSRKIRQQPAPLSRVDILTVRYIFTVFRGNIIPETCALIYLQGQIRDNLAVAEDFPLNLWDMERVYEGVYQFLEFFAVLTENNDWKRLLIDWEIVYDLVTLIKELDASVPKANLVSQIPAPGKSAARHTYQAYQAAQPSTNSNVEHPYDPPLPPLPPAPQYDPMPVPQFIQSPSLQQVHSVRPHATSPGLPSLFEWRNLKKLIILVLSSLVWKCPTVQDQIRLNGGVETILSCTQYDSHNPYIKEHAVMCIRFLLEGNAENQRIVRELEARGVANGADLEREYGVKADVDAHGKVKVEQKAKRQELDESKRQMDYVRYQNFLAQDRVLSEESGTNGRPAEHDRHDHDPLTAVATESRGTIQSHPVRRASESAAATTTNLSGLGQTTAERIASMTERFNKLDISRFAQGLPIRNTNTVLSGSTIRSTSPMTNTSTNFDAPINGSRIIEEIADDDIDVHEEAEESSSRNEHVESNDEHRLLDVGDML